MKIFSFLLYFLQSCKHESWVGVAKYLMDDVPLLLKLEDVKDIQEVLSVVFMSLPSNFEDFIKWVAEVRSREDVGQTLSTEEKARLAVKVRDFEASHKIFPRVIYLSFDTIFQIIAPKV